MDGLKIRMHPTLDILCREDGAVLMPKGWTFGAGKRGWYKQVVIDKESFYVHQLVCETFHINYLNKPTVDHIDRDKTNNFASNLRFATYSEQTENSAIVLNAANYGVRFKDNPNAYKLAWAHAHPDSKRQSAAKYNQKQKEKGLIYSKCADGHQHWHKPGEDPWEIK